MTDMRSNMVAVVLLLVMGIMILRLVTPASYRSKPRWGLGAVAFVSGPVVALVWLLADIAAFSPKDYLTPEDYFGSLIPMLIVGFIGGAIGAAAIWLTDGIAWCGRRQRANPNTRGADEPERPPDSPIRP